MKHLSCVEFGAFAELQCFYGIDKFKEDAISWYEMWCKKIGDPSELTCCKLLHQAKTFFPGIAKAIEIQTRTEAQKLEEKPLRWLWVCQLLPVRPKLLQYNEKSENLLTLNDDKRQAGQPLYDECAQKVCNESQK
ncbi:hypothetical protein HPB50_004096 [Hyalomma asiaticum]|uniref:Uncharacterized protein n=1 Tax=Hyalomma asiaticum TaxID=266040 RepID=A0ACB7TC95_HYAAI|nr:hypothetical protein HPB50_004096 [Hyalomma asiaticum]